MRKVPARGPYGDRGVPKSHITLGPPHGKRRASVRPTYGRRRGIYGMATACQISTANVDMKKVITPRYNSTATPAACKT